MLASPNGDHETTPRSTPGGMRRARFTLLALVGAAAVLAHCGGGGDDDGAARSGTDPCTTVFKGKCGVACDDRSPCGAGMFCSNGACTAQCTAETGCSSGLTCSAQGRCVGNADGSGGSGGGGGTGGTFNVGGSGGGGGQGGNCPAIDIAFQKVIPTIVLLVDQSSSMTSTKLDPADPNSPNRWEALKTALLNDDGVLKTLQSDVRFGVTFYSGQGQSDTPRACLKLTTEAPALNNYQDIADKYPADTIDNTPTAESHNQVTDDLRAFPEAGPKFIVLATDGNPDRCADPNQDDDPDTTSKDLSVKALQDAYNNDHIGTYVIGVSKNSVDRDHLRQLALAGQGKPTDSPEELFFEVGTQKQLGDALSTIINGARSCSFDLSASITNEAAPKGTVTVDGDPKTFNDPNGWRLSDSDTLEFVGTACEQIKAGAQQVKATFPCGTGGITPLPPR